MTTLQRVLYFIVTPFVRLFVYVLGKFDKRLANKTEYKTVFDAETAKVLTDAVDVEPYFMLDHALKEAERWRFRFPFYAYRKVVVVNDTSSRDTRKGWNLGEKDTLEWIGERTIAIPNGRKRR